MSARRPSARAKSLSIDVSRRTTVASRRASARSPQRPCQPSYSLQRLACPSSSSTGRVSGVLRPSKLGRSAGAVQVQPTMT